MERVSPYPFKPLWSRAEGRGEFLTLWGKQGRDFTLIYYSHFTDEESKAFAIKWPLGPNFKFLLTLNPTHLMIPLSPGHSQPSSCMVAFKTGEHVCWKVPLSWILQEENCLSSPSSYLSCLSFSVSRQSLHPLPVTWKWMHPGASPLAFFFPFSSHSPWRSIWKIPSIQSVWDWFRQEKLTLIVSLPLTILSSQTQSAWAPLCSWNLPISEKSFLSSYLVTLSLQVFKRNSEN